MMTPKIEKIERFTRKDFDKVRKTLVKKVFI